MIMMKLNTWYLSACRLNKLICHAMSLILLEKRLEQLEVKGEFGEVQKQPAVPTLYACYSGESSFDIEYVGLLQCMMSL